jgi:hypothetical protein
MRRFASLQRVPYKKVRYTCMLLITSCVLSGTPRSIYAESPQGKKQRLSRAFNELHRADVEQTWNSIITLVASDEAKKLREVEIVYTIDDTPLRFEVHPGERPVLFVTTGGLIIEDAIMEAYALFGSGYAGKLWLNEYILYLRQQHLGQSGFHLASTAAGIMGQKQIDGLSNQFKDLYSFYRKSALFFTLAHEAAHILQGDVVEQKDGESKSAFERRIQMQESRADRIAADILLKRDELPAGFVMLLVASMCIYEPRASIADSNLHVPDRPRIRIIAGWIKDSIARDHRVGTNNYRSMLNESLETLFKITEPHNYATMLRERDSDLRHPSFPHLNLPDVSN